MRILLALLCPIGFGEGKRQVKSCFSEGFRIIGDVDSAGFVHFPSETSFYAVVYSAKKRMLATVIVWNEHLEA